MPGLKRSLLADLIRDQGDEYTAAQVGRALVQGYQTQGRRSQAVFGLQPDAVRNEDVALAEKGRGSLHR